MNPVRLVARPLIASKFILDGVDHVRHPAVRADAVAPLVRQLSSRAAQVPNDPELLVRVNGAAMSAAGVLLAFGKMPRVSSTVLAVTALPANFADNDFWNESEREAKVAKRKRFLTNLGLFGGVLLATVDTAGQPGIAWRGNRAVRDAQRASRVAKREARHALHDAKQEARIARARVEAALP